MRFRRAASVLILIYVLASASAAGQAPTVEIAGVAKAGPVSIGELTSMTHVNVTLSEDGESVVYSGPLLSAVLARAGAPSGSTMRGAALTNYVVAEAKDGYRVVFSLGEIDPELGNSKIIIAVARNGKPLFDYQGPLRLIVAGDKRGARGVRMLTKLTIAQVHQ